MKTEINLKIISIYLLKIYALKNIDYYQAYKFNVNKRKIYLLTILSILCAINFQEKSKEFIKLNRIVNNYGQ